MEYLFSEIYTHIQKQAHTENNAMHTPVSPLSQYTSTVCYTNRTDFFIYTFKTGIINYHL